MIPKKLYYSISEVCSMTELEQHVLRYWESEFPQLKPKKNRAGNRAYREKDIDIINYIKHLLYEEKFTITGAKKKLSESKQSLEPDDDTSEHSGTVTAMIVNEPPKESPAQLEHPLAIVPKELDEIKKELRSILDYILCDNQKMVPKN
jgi:DNA-binding transcriptional MerR regulator